MKGSFNAFSRRLAALLLALLSLWLAPASAEAQFLGEIRWVAFDYPLDSSKWADCNGQILPINQNQALFSLLGTTFGGNGQTNFALPDLRGRSVVGYGTSYSLGQTGGSESHTLTIAEMPAHAHTVQMRAYSGPGNANSPQNALPAQAAGGRPDYSSTATGTMNAAGVNVGMVGGSQPHPNMPPYLVLRPIIYLQGVYPSRQ